MSVRKFLKKGKKLWKSNKYYCVQEYYQKENDDFSQNWKSGEMGGEGMPHTVYFLWLGAIKKLDLD